MDTPDNFNDSPYRLLAPMMDRWLSPDPAGLAAVNLSNPQTWNAYAYVANQPLEYTDPLGPITEVQPYQPPSPCPAPWTCLDPSFWQFEFGQWPPPLQLPTSQNGGGAAPIETVPIRGGIHLSPSITGPACTEKILADVNNQFGTDFTDANLEPGQPPFPNGGAININILGTGLPAAEFNAIQTGRYPVHWWTWVVGDGPTLHVTGRTWLDPPPAVFQNSNVGGGTSVLFTAHIDSSFAYNPIGAVVHLLEDVFHVGGPRNPCP